MKTIKYQKPYFIGTLSELIKNEIKAEFPKETDKFRNQKIRKVLAQRLLNKPINIYRAPGNNNRILSTDSQITDDLKPYLDTQAIIRWVGDNGEVVIELK